MASMLIRAVSWCITARKRGGGSILRTRWTSTKHKSAGKPEKHAAASAQSPAAAFYGRRCRQGTKKAAQAAFCSRWVMASGLHAQPGQIGGQFTPGFQPGDHAGAGEVLLIDRRAAGQRDRKSTRLNSSHVKISYAVF